MARIQLHGLSEAWTKALEGALAQEELVTELPDVVILSGGLADVAGHLAMDLLVPVIVISGDVTVPEAVAIMRGGAYDLIYAAEPSEKAVTDVVLACHSALAERAEERRILSETRG